ncbi:ABC transporter permease [Mycoplasmatota bacterium]|nr:ABC transporter permease [Mycoplasmatota bacterium]
MRAIIKSFRIFLSQISRDGMLIMILISPVLAGFFFRFGIPEIEKQLVNYLGQASVISDYYGLIDLFLVTMTPYMFCFAAAMTMLDEYDNNIINHLTVTPIRKKGYLISRLVIPTLLSFVASIFILLIFSLTSWSIVMVIIICFLTSFMSMSLSLIVFSFSKNKIEGMAVAKLSGLVMIGLVIPYFIDNGTQYLFSFLPSFWIAKLMISPNYLSFLYATITSILWIWLLYKKFDKKLSS